MFTASSLLEPRDVVLEQAEIGARLIIRDARRHDPRRAEEIEDLVRKALDDLLVHCYHDRPPEVRS